MMECFLLKAVVTTAMWTVPVSCSADVLRKDEVQRYLQGASQQVEVYVGQDPKPELLEALAGLANRELAVSVLISPSVRQADAIVDKLTSVFAVAPGDPATICVLAAASGDETVIVVDHLSYREDFDPSRAVGFTLEAGEEWNLVQLPGSQVLADKTEALSGNCRS